MAYDAYGRPQRGNGESGYFDPSDPTPEYLRHYPIDPRDNLPSPRHGESSNPRQRFSPPINDRMTSASERPEPAGHESVSPEVIAAITERIKREVFEHLKQTGSVDDPHKAPPMQRQPSNKSSSTSSPPPTTRRVYTPPSPTQPPRPANVAPPPMDSMRSPPSSPLDKPSGVRFSDRGPPRPTAGGRTYSTAELSTVDQKWGRLFDAEGRPTHRLGQFLRGLANHIIDDFQPKKSIVVTPSKMAAYYASHPLDKEPHPLLSIFRAQSNEHISQLYQDLGCQHHLIQEHSSMPPIVPALTPLGFAHWMTINILAYPEEEARRLEKVVLAMPVDADGEMIDGKPERLPKQISRYLLPEHEDRKSRKLLDGAIKDFLEDLGTTRRHKSTITSPPLSRHSSTSQSRRDSQSRRPPVEIHQARTSPTTPKPNPLERERKPYSGAPNSDASSNEEGIKIERDRQPYSAQPGNGRIYENLNLPNRPGRTNSTSRTREPDIPESRHNRAQSNASRDTYMPPPRTGGRRTSSPPLKSFSQSTPTDIDSGSKYGPAPSSSSSSFTHSQQSQSTFSPGSYGSNTSAFPPPPPPIDIRDRRAMDPYGRRAREDESTARLASEFNSPRDAERWDRYQEARGVEGFERPYERGSVGVDPRDSVPRGAPAEDWYREKARGNGYDEFRRYG